jgi:serine protease Do
VPKLGLTLAPGKADGGVVVTAVDPSGVAADHGFQVGDVILDISGKSVASPSDVRRQIADARKEGKHTLLFRVKSNAGTRFVALPLGNA